MLILTSKAKAMISLNLTPNLSSSSALLSSVNPLGLSTFKPLYHHLRKKNPNHLQRRIRNGTCRAELSTDAPFVLAIGTCMLTSLLLPLPVSSGRDDVDNDSAIDSTDTRFAVMGIISFIPYFNWLSWVFAWLDSGKRRYALYSLVYFAPYLRSNLSLSPEESWLPIASIIFCIVHIQLEASIRNGDLQSFQLFNQASKHFSSGTKKKDTHLKGHEGILEEGKTNEVRRWGVPEKPLKNPEHLNEDWDDK